MSNSALQFTGGIPDNYDNYLVPHIFVDYAADMARRAGALEPRRVLELASGTGIVTRGLRDALPAACELTATDISPPMLEYAQAKFSADESVRFEAVDATELSYGDAAFDLAVCQFGVMFFPDKERSYREVHRVLEPGGSYLFSVWDSMAANPFAKVALETLGRFFEEDPPVFLHVPFGYNNVDEIEKAVKAAGFGQVSHERIKMEKEIPSVANFARGLVYGNPSSEEIKERGTATPDEVMMALQDGLEAAFGKDPGTMPLEAIIFKAERL